MEFNNYIITGVDSVSPTSVSHGAPKCGVEFNNYIITGDDPMSLTKLLQGAPHLILILWYQSGVISGHCDLLIK